MISLLEKLKDKISKAASREEFVHGKWYVEHHLTIVEKLALEFCDIYPAADRDVVLGMVWLHDYGKILTNKALPRDEEDQVTFLRGKELLEEIGFAPEFIARVITNLETFERYKTEKLTSANIEVQIASTADGCAHLVGPFMSLHWYENAHLGIDDLIASGIKKVMNDWEYKIVLPEARIAFEPRMKAILEQDARYRGAIVLMPQV